MKTVKPTAVDRLWLLRAVQAEGEPRREVAEALVNLYALSSARGAPIPSLSALVRAYAQPVNPRWFESGDLFRESLERAHETARPAMIAAARRRERVHSTRTVFDPAVVAAVDYALSGEHRTDVTDYAAPNVDASRKGYEPRSSQQTGKNRLWTRKPGWTGYVAAVATGGGSVVALLLAAVVIGLAWKAGT